MLRENWNGVEQDDAIETYDKTLLWPGKEHVLARAPLPLSVINLSY